MSLATLQEFYDRVDSDILLQLSLKNWTNGDTVTDEQAAQRDVKCQAALDDASAKLLAYRPRIASDFWPDADAQRGDCVRVALYMLAVVKGFGEFKQIQDAYANVIAFYDNLVEQTASAAGGGAEVGVTTQASCPIFNRRSLRGQS